MHIVTMVITTTGHSHSGIARVIERTLNGRVIFLILTSLYFSGQALGVDKFTSFVNFKV